MAIQPNQDANGNPDLTKVPEVPAVALLSEQSDKFACSYLSFRFVLTLEAHATVSSLFSPAPRSTAFYHFLQICMTSRLDHRPQRTACVGHILASPGGPAVERGRRRGAVRALFQLRGLPDAGADGGADARPDAPADTDAVPRALAAADG